MSSASQTICTLGIKVVDALEYMHSKGYTHNDVKGANLMLGRGAGEVFLLDLGLARTYLASSGGHTPYKPDAKYAHNGTLEFTSRDAHVGATSRRGDLETLGYSLVLWETGALPWAASKNKDRVHADKIAVFEDTSRFLRDAFPARDVPGYLEEYFKLVARLEFEQEPDYDAVRAIFKGAGDGELDFPCLRGVRESAAEGQKEKDVGGENSKIDKDKDKAKKPAAKKRDRRSTSTPSRLETRKTRRNDQEPKDA